VHLNGQAKGTLVRYGMNADGTLLKKELQGSPSIATEDLAPIYRQISGDNGDNDFVIIGNRSWNSGRIKSQSEYAPRSVKLADNAALLDYLLDNRSKSGTLPAIVHVHTGHNFFGNDGTLEQGGHHVINIE